MEESSLKSNRIRLGLTLFIFGLAVLNLPSVASAAVVDFSARIVVKDANGSTLGYLTEDPNYWTPLIAADPTAALVVDFTLNGTTGAGLNLATENSGQTPFPYLGLVQGRDSTNGDIGAGSFNYLYIDGANGTAPGDTPQHPGNYFSTGSGLDHASESALWTIDINALTLIPVWVNSDGSTPATQVFIQSNHVYGGGDASAFHSRFPAPVSSASLYLEILSSVEQPEPAPEPASLGTLALGIFGLGMLRRRRSNPR
jgi:hypothetical protein